MSDLTGNFSYEFTTINPNWDNTLKTGISSITIGLTCSYSGDDTHNVAVTDSYYSHGTTGFVPPVTFDYLSGNIESICNGYASGRNWWYDTKQLLTNQINSPISVDNFPFPTDGAPQVFPSTGDLSSPAEGSSND